MSRRSSPAKTRSSAFSAAMAVFEETTTTQPGDSRSLRRASSGRETSPFDDDNASLITLPPTICTTRGNSPRKSRTRTRDLSLPPVVLAPSPALLRPSSSSRTRASRADLPSLTGLGPTRTPVALAIQTTPTPAHFRPMDSLLSSTVNDADSTTEDGAISQPKRSRRQFRRTETCVSTLPGSFEHNSASSSIDAKSGVGLDGLDSTPIPSAVSQHIHAPKRSVSSSTFTAAIARANSSEAGVQALLDLFPLPGGALPVGTEIFNDDSGVSDSEWPASSSSSSSSSCSSSSDELANNFCLDPLFPGHSSCHLRIEGTVVLPAQYAFRVLRRRFYAAHFGRGHTQRYYIGWRDHKDMLGKNGRIFAFWGPSPLGRGLRGVGGAKLKIFVDVDRKALKEVMEVPRSSVRLGRGLGRSMAIGNFSGLALEGADEHHEATSVQANLGRSNSPLRSDPESADRGVDALSGIENEMMFEPPPIEEIGDASFDGLAGAVGGIPTLETCPPSIDMMQASNDIKSASMLEAPVIEHGNMNHVSSSVQSALSEDTSATNVHTNVSTPESSMVTRSSDQSFLDEHSYLAKALSFSTGLKESQETQGTSTGNDSGSNDLLAFLANQAERDEYEEARSRFEKKTGTKIVANEPTPVIERMEAVVAAEEGREDVVDGKNAGFLGCFGAEADLFGKMSKQIEKLDVKVKAQETSHQVVKAVRSWVPKLWRS